MELSARTDIGNKRAENQDSYRAQAHTDGKAWLAVCDGMGGARGGRLASGLAVASIEQVLCAGSKMNRRPFPCWIIPTS